MKVLIIGASKNPERYSYKAMKRLEENGHSTILFNPTLSEIEGHPVVNSLSNIHEHIDTVTLYVGEKHLLPMVNEIIALKPRRIISNPGTETTQMREAAEKAGILYLEACTLVLLATYQF
ncbi:MAG TPA: CoA-binding protein [Treponemataceae bacterium]|nr:CoA-binding protein [Treponemataceae bacterium]